MLADFTDEQTKFAEERHEFFTRQAIAKRSDLLGSLPIEISGKEWELGLMGRQHLSHFTRFAVTAFEGATNFRNPMALLKTGASLVGVAFAAAGDMAKHSYEVKILNGKKELLTTLKEDPESYKRWVPTENTL